MLKEKDFQKKEVAKPPINLKPPAAITNNSPASHKKPAKTKQAEKELSHPSTTVAGLALPLASRNTAASSMMLPASDLGRLAPSSSSLLAHHDEHFLRQQQLLDLSFARSPLLSGRTRTQALSASLLLGQQKSHSVFAATRLKPPSTSLQQYMLDQQRLLSATATGTPLAARHSLATSSGVLGAHEHAERLERQINLEMAVAEQAAAARRRRLSASLWAANFP